MRRLDTGILIQMERFDRAPVEAPGQHKGLDEVELGIAGAYHHARAQAAGDALRRIAAAASAAAADASRLDGNTRTCMAPAWNVLIGDDMAYLSSEFRILTQFGTRRPRGDEQTDNQRGGERHGTGSH